MQHVRVYVGSASVTNDHQRGTAPGVLQPGANEDRGHCNLPPDGSFASSEPPGVGVRFQADQHGLQALLQRQ